MGPDSANQRQIMGIMPPRSQEGKERQKELSGRADRRRVRKELASWPTYHPTRCGRAHQTATNKGSGKCRGMRGAFQEGESQEVKREQQHTPGETPRYPTRRYTKNRGSEDQTPIPRDKRKHDQTAGRNFPRPPRDKIEPHLDA